MNCFFKNVYGIPWKIVSLAIFLPFALWVLLTDFSKDPEDKKINGVLIFLIELLYLKKKGLPHLVNCGIWIAVFATLIKLSINH